MADLPAAQLRAGFVKIKGVCRIARERNMQYAWVDTCCIYKSSSAELSESINSMLYWYQKAAACIAYLDDLKPSIDPQQPEATEDELRPYRWFTGGWTLQELIAPRTVEFGDGLWRFRGDKQSLHGSLSRITRIAPEVLGGSAPLGQLAVARRLSWAVTRQTTRVEDAAYCLMGIFDVNMPLHLLPITHVEQKTGVVRLR